MAKWLKEGVPVDRGTYKGCLRVRWRPAKEAPWVTGYLPGDEPKLKLAYDDYEKRCWDELAVPEAPEVRFAAQMERFLGARAAKVEAVREEIAKAAEEPMTLRRWVGTKAEPGPFWDCSRAKGEKRKSRYWKLRADLGGLLDVPMNQIGRSQIMGYFHKVMACCECVQRANAAGQEPGVDIEWRRLVPLLGQDTFDGQQCSEHETPRAEPTYDSLRTALHSLFEAGRSDLAKERFGPDGLVSFNPVPSPGDVFLRTVIFPVSEDEEMRFALDEAQLWLLTDASPALYRAIPFTAAFTLNRGGQELTGMRIGDFSWVQASTGHRVGCIDLRHFDHALHSGRRVLMRKGKTSRSARSVFVPTFVAQMIEDHIREFRSTPSAVCDACNRGERHWGGENRDSRGRNPHVGCDFAADAPLWVNDKGAPLDPTWYSKQIWHPVCERVGLTKESLGWKPLLKHSRSSGTVAHLERGTDIREVVRLGGWRDERMVREHYERYSKEGRARHVAGWDDEAAGADAVSIENRRLLREVARLRAVLVTHSIDPDTVIEPLQRSAGTKLSDPKQVVDAVVRAAAMGQAPSAALNALGVAAAAKNYKRVAAVCAAAGMPCLASGRQLPNGTKPYEIKEWSALVGDWATSRTSLAEAS